MRQTQCRHTTLPAEHGKVPPQNFMISDWHPNNVITLLSIDSYCIINKLLSRHRRHAVTLPWAAALTERPCERPASSLPLACPHQSKLRVANAPCRAFRSQTVSWPFSHQSARRAPSGENASPGR